LIDVQKRRAIARWEEAYAKKYFEKDIYDCVLEKLKVGEVLPMYHTLCCDPSKRLFLPNTFVSSGNAESGRIKLSLEKVQAGSSKIHPTLLRSLWTSTQRSFNAIGWRFLDLAGYLGSIWNRYDFSYLHSLNCGINDSATSVRKLYRRCINTPMGYRNYPDQRSSIIVPYVSQPKCKEPMHHPTTHGWQQRVSKGFPLISVSSLANPRTLIATLTISD
jgi:hypothetical protein